MKLLRDIVICAYDVYFATFKYCGEHCNYYRLLVCERTLGSGSVFVDAFARHGEPAFAKQLLYYRNELVLRSGSLHPLFQEIHDVRSIEFAETEQPMVIVVSMILIKLAWKPDLNWKTSDGIRFVAGRIRPICMLINSDDWRLRDSQTKSRTCLFLKGVLSQSCSSSLTSGAIRICLDKNNSQRAWLVQVENMPVSKKKMASGLS